MVTGLIILKYWLMCEFLKDNFLYNEKSCFLSALAIHRKRYAMGQFTTMPLEPNGPPAGPVIQPFWPFLESGTPQSSWIYSPYRPRPLSTFRGSCPKAGCNLQTLQILFSHLIATEVPIIPFPTPYHQDVSLPYAEKACSKVVAPSNECIW